MLREDGTEMLGRGEFGYDLDGDLADSSGCISAGILVQKQCLFAAVINVSVAGCKGYLPRLVYSRSPLT